MRSSNTSAPLAILPLIAEVGGALLGGVVLALLCGVGISLLLANANLGMGLLTAQVYAAIVGFGIGAGAGAALGGRISGQTGNWLLAVVGGLITGIVVAFVMRVFTLGTLLMTLGVAVFLMVVVAVVGYNLRRQS